MRLYFKVTDQYNEHWQFDWITSDFWHVLNFVFLGALCFLFRPSPRSTRFSYTDVDGRSFTGKELLNFTSKSGVPLPSPQPGLEDV